MSYSRVSFARQRLASGESAFAAGSRQFFKGEPQFHAHRWSAAVYVRASLEI
jgi:hypothetical protein